MKRFSVITDDMDHCYICGRNRECLHEVFYGTANRKLSIKYGMVIPLCNFHHNMSDMGIHFNYFLDTKVKQEAQYRFNEVYPDLDFLQIFGKNYL